MVRFFITRLLVAIFTLVSVLTAVFLIVRVIPGDPALVILGDQAGSEALVATRERLGLDRPLIIQYWDFLSGIFHGDLGRSMITDAPVSGELMKVLPLTLELTGVGIVFGLAVGLPLGIWAAIRRNRMADYLIRILSLAGLSFPVFVSGIVLMLVFSIRFPVFPVVSDGSGGLGNQLRSLVLPGISLALVMAAYVTRVTRSSMLGVLNEDYVRTARAKGLKGTVVVWRHCFRNALMPVVTVIGLYIGVLIGSSVLTEIVFSRPGLGKLIVGAISQRDYTMLQGLIVVYTFIVIVVNLVTDLTYGLIDPRIRVN
ncbi:ABC transporter permease [Mesorhizobium sp. NZP2077]|uniref:ABC transporter permease n=1 Tax=Mesorhizobium sp. NZP2077 TaxID=2483404 RepID=UPI0015550486|nr:ABC transporter permease [Mesorhizobium sp. NZP2077]QKC86829.1 ABC transporter permease [Mesorhizobium sp. NZP2077]QKD20535.1 ABC transporter permease [Mesorhizobium sp. NZP2077]